MKVRAIAAPSACACGRGCRCCKRWRGDGSTFSRRRTGAGYPASSSPHILKDLPAIRRYQVVQERLDTIVVKIVAPDWAAADEAWLRHEVAAVAGPSIRLDLERVAEILLTAAGKLQVVVNRLGTPGGEKT